MMARLRERYERALAGYRTTFGVDLPPAVSGLMRARGRSVEVLHLIEKALERHAPVSSAEWHALVSTWLRVRKRLQGSARGVSLDF